MDEKRKLDYKERYSKWQFKQIDYLTFNINLLLTLSIAIVGFILSNESIFNNHINFPTKRCVLYLFTGVITIGVLINVLRYYDFKYTKDILKYRKKTLTSNTSLEKVCFESKICKLRNRTNLLGKINRRLFVVMPILFLAAIWMTIFNM